MDNIKEFLRETLCDIAYNCHKKDFNDDFKAEIKRIEALYPFIKEQLQNMEEDISLYRYKPLNSYAKMEIEQQKIFMNIPSKFDDLFDSNIIFDIEETDSNYAPHFHAVYCSKLLEENGLIPLQDSDMNGWEDIFKDINSDIDKLVKVSSLSEDYKNIPLWYYYANENKGICIEYSLKEIMKKLKENEYIMPVIYTNNYFKYNPAIVNTPEGRKMSIQSNVLIKHDSWKFENEWRIVQICNQKLEEYTDEIPIKSVTFGLKTDECDKLELKNLNKDIDFYELKRTCYGLKRVKITENQTH